MWFYVSWYCKVPNKWTKQIKESNLADRNQLIILLLFLLVKFNSIFEQFSFSAIFGTICVKYKCTTFFISFNFLRDATLILH